MNEDWSEDTINWTSQPSDITWTDKFLNFTSSGISLFNISSIISRSEMNFSLFLSDLDYNNDFTIAIYSSEVPNSEEIPVLIFYYSSENYGLISSFPLLIIGLMSIISMIFKTYRLQNEGDIS
ncbi:MAG: hypothetical protein ACFFAS_07840 [Promethearchaeota archaeon]